MENVPVEVGKVYKIRIRGIAGNNEGVGLVDGFPVYVKNAPEGKEVKVRVIKIHKHYATGELL